MAMILTLSMITARAPEYLPLYLVGSGAIVTLLISAIIMLRSRCPSCGQLFSQTAMREEALYTDIITETTMPRKSPAAHYPLSIYSSACKNCGRIRLFVK
ncbi:hypothetical protein KJ865_08775 [Myxococcota bacterium]|nr:hypothetical protein [Myxococcota bacterium]